MQPNPLSTEGNELPAVHHHAQADHAQADHALAALLLQRQTRLWPRFLSMYARLRLLPCGWRRRMQRKTAVTLAGAALLLALGRAPTPAHAATISVANGEVGIADNNICSLIEAIQNANDTALPMPHDDCVAGSPAGADTISLPGGGLFTLTQSFATLYDSYTGLPLITSAITLSGNGSTIARDTLDPDKFRFLAVSSSGNLTLNDVTLTGGHAYTTDGGDPYPDTSGNGGAIYNNGRLTIRDGTISGNKAEESGGGLYNYLGTADIYDSEINDNEARRGGGLYNDQGILTIHNSTISGNEATDGDGGAIYTDQEEATTTLIETDITDNKASGDGGGLNNWRGTTHVINSTIIGNDAGDEGGAAYNDHEEATLTIVNSTISDNEASDDGGAINNFDGTVQIINSTVSDNTSGGRGGAIYNDHDPTSLTITNSLLSGNDALYEGGAIFNWNGNMTITASTIFDNYSGEDGGGIYMRNSDTIVHITNSTISGNEAYSYGGGIYKDDGQMVITNSTITDNIADEKGGGMFNDGTVTFSRTIISGNAADDGRELYNDFDYGFVNANNFNLFGFNNDAGTANFAPGANDIVPGAGVTAADILDPLADNGGPTETHALAADSLAIDAAPSADCDLFTLTNDRDQRGYARNVDGDSTVSTNECDVGAYEAGSAPTEALFMTAAGPGTTNNGVAFGKEDILFWDGDGWSKFFDGSDAGLTSGKAAHDINAIHISGEEDIYLSFFQNKIKTTNLGNVMGTDILHYNGSTFQVYFDGSDVGLDKVAQEKIDGLHILDGSQSPIGDGCDAYLLISTFGTGKVPAFGGGVINFSGEDVLGFCATNTGAATSGFWTLVLDGSAEGMPKNSTDSISASDNGSALYLTTKTTFDVDDANGSHSVVYKFEAGRFSGPIFSAPANGLNQKVDGLHIEGDLP